MADQSDQESEEQRFAERIGELLARVLLPPTIVLLFSAAAYAIGDALLADSPSPEDPNVLDRVLASEAVLAAVRVAIVFAATYIVISVVALVMRRQWLTRVGPVEVSEQVTGAVAENAALESRLLRAEDTIEDLQGKLTRMAEALGAVLGRITDADEEGE